jgi:hypothetical protein
MIDGLGKNVFDIPVLLIVFNRPNNFKKLIDSLRQIKPNKIFIVADGPRAEVQSDKESCAATRALINDIDWDTDIKTLFFDVNHGSGVAPFEGINWVFQQVEKAIILEDDCLPSAAFFRYCNELLSRYEFNEKVMTISGNNHLLGRVRVKNSYWFSAHTQTHGWATWKRSWELYDFYMKDWPQFKLDSSLYGILNPSRYEKKWEKILDDVYHSVNTNDKYDCWDFQLAFACWRNGMVNIIPSVNLVSNIGYGENATHKTPLDHPLSNLPALEMQFPLEHPEQIKVDKRADLVLSQNVFNNHSLIYRVVRKLIRAFT